MENDLFWWWWKKTRSLLLLSNSSANVSKYLNWWIRNTWIVMRTKCRTWLSFNILFDYIKRWTLFATSSSFLVAYFDISHAQKTKPSQQDQLYFLIFLDFDFHSNKGDTAFFEPSLHQGVLLILLCDEIDCLLTFEVLTSPQQNRVEISRTQIFCSSISIYIKKRVRFTTCLQMLVFNCELQNVKKGNVQLDAASIREEGQESLTELKYRLPETPTHTHTHIWFPVGYVCVCVCVSSFLSGHFLLPNLSDIVFDAFFAFLTKFTLC